MVNIVDSADTGLRVVPFLFSVSADVHGGADIGTY